VSELIGWLATVIFAGSYFVRNSANMRWVQAGAALCWIMYGILVHAKPVIAANLLVVTLAAYTAWRTAPLENPAKQ
jgi:hypothetical protein